MRDASRRVLVLRRLLLVTLEIDLWPQLPPPRSSSSLTRPKGHATHTNSYGFSFPLVLLMMLSILFYFTQYRFTDTHSHTDLYRHGKTGRHTQPVHDSITTHTHVSNSHSFLSFFASTTASLDPPRTLLDSLFSALKDLSFLLPSETPRCYFLHLPSPRCPYRLPRCWPPPPISSIALTHIFISIHSCFTLSHIDIYTHTHMPHTGAASFFFDWPVGTCVGVILYRKCECGRESVCVRQRRHTEGRQQHHGKRQEQQQQQ